MSDIVYKPWVIHSKHLQKRDRRLGLLIKQIGPPCLQLEKNPFHALGKSILSQQLNSKVASIIIGRVGQLSPPFPTAKAFLRIPMDSILKAGVSKPKVKYLLALSEKWVDASWRKGWDTLSNEELTNRLIEVKGIGEWTAHMFLIFSLGKPDVLPVGDFGIRRGLQRLRELTQMPLPKEIPDLVKEWQGSESVGAWYLWQALDRKIL